MKNTIFTYSIIGVACLLANSLTAQCTPFFGLETFDGATNEWTFTSDFSEETDAANPMDGPDYIKSTAADASTSKCFDLQGLTQAKISFIYRANTADALTLSYTTPGSSATTLWTNDDDTGANVIIDDLFLDVPKVDDVTLKFTASEADVYLDGIQLESTTVDVCFSYDLAGNRTAGSLIVTLVEEEDPVDSFVSEEGGEESAIVAIDETSLIKRGDYKVFPNPTSNIVNIQSRTGFESHRLVLYSDHGQKIMEQPLSGSASIDLSEQQNGVYFIHIIGENNKLNYKVLKI